MQNRKISNALISVFDKSGLDPILETLSSQGVTFFSTGGTEAYIKKRGYKVVAIESLTGYPSILGGRVKTLHPKVFGGILNRAHFASDQEELVCYDIPVFDLVIVDLYPFETTVKSGASEADIIEKIDIGGIALIRAAAKNFNDVLCVSSKDQYHLFLEYLKQKKGEFNIEDRKNFSVKAFHTSSHYDAAIFNYFNSNEMILKVSSSDSNPLRYGENPHQKGTFFGPLEDILEQLHGKSISYNNLLDIDSAVQLMNEFYDGPAAFGILKHNNACGFAVRKELKQAYEDALAGDPISAFGGILITNKTIDISTAEKIHSLFCEVVIAPAFNEDALSLLKEKKNRILLLQKDSPLPDNQIRSCLNGVLLQEADRKTDTLEDLTYVTNIKPDPSAIEDLLFASKICKHTKSNTIVLCNNRQLLASGTGQTSRVDALQQAISKAKHFGFKLKDAAMASDAFFPFPDCVEIAGKEGINKVIQPGGSIRDQNSIDYCNQHNITMVFSGIRHFKH